MAMSVRGIGGWEAYDEHGYMTWVPDGPSGKGTSVGDPLPGETRTVDNRVEVWTGNRWYFFGLISVNSPSMFENVTESAKKEIKMATDLEILEEAMRISSGYPDNDTFQDWMDHNINACEDFWDTAQRNLDVPEHLIRPMPDSVALKPNMDR